MKKRAEKQLMLVAAMTYQAVEGYERTRKYTLPKGYRLVTTFGEKGDSCLGYLAQSKRKIIICFRGTETFTDVTKDMAVTQVRYPFVPNAGNTHKGYTEMYQEIIRPQLLKCLQKLSSTKRMLVCGHSMGGAIATLAALDISQNTRFEHPYVYTFASPRVGNGMFVYCFNKLVTASLRISNRFDIVPHFPLKRFFRLRYRHVNTLYPLSFQLGNPVANHSMVNYFETLCKQHEAECKRICRKPGVCPVSFHD